MMEKNVIDLFTLQTEVRQSLESSFPARVWVRAEVSAVKVRGGGHCYLELSQSDESGLVAKASAIIWASRYRVLGPYFESVAGSPLQPGITVLLRVQVNYSQLYGLSLIVDDIDASCTLGEKEKERLATIERLKKEGLLDRQKSLEMTALPYRLAVVSAPDAAGYRDFERHLKGNAYGFVLETVLYEAVMQGASAPESISDALKAAASAEKPFDAVLVLRGAIDHSARYPQSVNLNKEGYFVCYNNTYFTNTTYHPVPGDKIDPARYMDVAVKTGIANAYTFSINSPTALLFRLRGEPDVRQVPGSTVDKVTAIPYEDVIDAVEVFSGSSSANAKRLIPELDAGYVSLQNSFLCHTLMRSRDEAASEAAGYEILSDTNNSSNDFYERETQSLHD